MVCGCGLGSGSTETRRQYNSSSSDHGRRVEVLVFSSVWRLQSSLSISCSAYGCISANLSEARLVQFISRRDCVEERPLGQLDEVGSRSHAEA